nr:LEAF RUST 10 DISEASE-RESISTANCE LOCUS RECEPTOR-LIKE PROTEIN KINASE-like 1.4 isoform X1 [Ipomoea batatas]
MKVRYRVLEINQTVNIITITRKDFAVGICEGQSFNATLDSTLFDFASRYVNFTYKFSCPPSVALPELESMPPIPKGFDCLVSRFNFGNGYVHIGGPGGAGTCEASVVIPVRNSTVVAEEDVSEFLGLKEILGEGFDVKWKLCIERIMLEIFANVAVLIDGQEGCLDQQIQADTDHIHDHMHKQRQIMTGKRGGYQLGKSFCDNLLTIACKFARDSCAHQLGKYDPRFIGSACRPGFANHHLL